MATVYDIRAGDNLIVVCPLFPSRFQENDIIIVCLEHMIAADTTLNEVFNLDYGEGAQREYVGGEWTRYALEEEDDEDEESS
ncbi:MAG: hypothetical protein LBS49_13040 [Candidatus Accumulibacter sp.]|nr:hypothetical protein [Accumulibacter sp.]